MSSPEVILFVLQPIREFAKTTELDSAHATVSPALGKLQTWYWTQVQHGISPSLMNAAHSLNCFSAYSSWIPKLLQFFSSILADPTVVWPAYPSPQDDNFASTLI